LQVFSINNFLENENGAVTVDMVPLMALVVALGLAVIGVAQTGVANLSRETSELMEGDSIISTSFASLQPSGSSGGGNGNNGFGNGDQDAPGNSEFNNNAENAGGNN